MAKTKNSYLDINGLTTLVGKYITGKTGSTYAVPANELATRIDFISLSTIDNKSLNYGYTYKISSTGTQQVVLGTVTITDALKDTYLSTTDSTISVAGKLSLYIKTSTGTRLVTNVNDSNKQTALDLTAFVKPSNYMTISSMESNYMTISSMDSGYLVLTTQPAEGQTSAPNKLISQTDMDNMTIATTVVGNLFN